MSLLKIANKHAGKVRYAANCLEFIEALEQCEANHELSPMEYVDPYDDSKRDCCLTTDSNGFFKRVMRTGEVLTVPRQYFYIQETDGIIVAGISFREDENSIKGRFSTRLDILPNGQHFRSKGYAIALRWAFMKHALSLGKVMASSGFTPDGQKSLLPVIPELHKHIPDLQIRYHPNEPIDGHCPYRVWGSSDITIVYE